MTNFENTLLPVSYNLYKKEIDQHLSLSEIITIISSDLSLDLQISAIRNEKNPQKQKHLKIYINTWYNLKIILLKTEGRFYGQKQMKTPETTYYKL